MQIVKFLIVNLLGFFSVSLATFYADAMGLIPALPEEFASGFRMYFFGGTMIAWLVGGVLSVLVFFVQGKLKTFFLLLPLLVPCLYALYILNIYNP